MCTGLLGPNLAWFCDGYGESFAPFLTRLQQLWARPLLFILSRSFTIFNL
jgi:hypothetical protein